MQKSIREMEVTWEEATLTLTFPSTDKNKNTFPEILKENKSETKPDRMQKAFRKMEKIKSKAATLTLKFPSIDKKYKTLFPT